MFTTLPGPSSELMRQLLPQEDQPNSAGTLLLYYSPVLIKSQSNRPSVTMHGINQVLMAAFLIIVIPYLLKWAILWLS